MIHEREATGKREFISTDTMTYSYFNIALCDFKLQYILKRLIRLK